MKLLNRIKAYIRLQEIKRCSNDLDTFTNDIYNAICSKTEYERSVIIASLRKKHETRLSKQYQAYNENVSRIEKALDKSIFTIV